MTTPVLSKKQQRKALSGKKASVKGLRNVLAQPYQFTWPILQNDNVDELKLLLKTSMPAIKRTSPNIPWTQLRRMNKMERQAVRKEAQLKLAMSAPDKNIMNSIVMGVNAVTRLLEKNNASCILLEENVEPLLLIKHIVSMANLRNVPVILVPFLKSMMLDTVGFACTALALKKTVVEAEDHHFHNLYKKVFELAANFEKSNMPLKLDFEEDSESRSSLEETIIIPEESCDKEKVKTNKLFTLSTDVYKYRNSRKERVFVPEIATGSEIATERLDNDFIGVGKDLGIAVGDASHVSNKTKTRYVDIHAEDNKNSPETKEDSMQLDEHVSADPNRTLTGSPSVRVNVMDIVVWHETKSAIPEIEQSPLDIQNNKLSNKNKNRKKNKNRNKNLRYESLKVKRLQGNVKRVKATKVPTQNVK